MTGSGTMPSFAFLPAKQDVYVTWSADGPTPSELRAIKLIVAELNDLTVTKLYHLARGRAEFHVGRFALLRAMELQRLLEENGLTVRLV